VAGVELRVDELAAQARVSVDTVRFYQSKGLLPAPRRVGRVAVYGREHAERLARIRALQAKGLSLATIARLLAGELDAADEALAAVVAGDQAAPAPPGSDRLLTLAQVAERSGIPLALLQAVEREGLLVPVQGGYTIDDAEVAAAGLKLLSLGLPLPEVLDLARRHHAAVREVAERAVTLFDEHVRQPLRSSGRSEADTATELVAAYHAMLPATLALVTHHFRRTLLAVAVEHIEQVGAESELAAIAADVAGALS
jgi:DNA-binding transcriptional MerR regulator